MNITTQYELGDRVTDDNTTTGRIIEIETVSNGVAQGILYRIEVEETNPDVYAPGYIVLRTEDRLKPAPKKLSPEEAWAHVGLMIGMAVSDTVYKCRFKDLADSDIRHRAYQILGGNGIDVGRKGTQRHEEVKVQLTRLIEAATLI